MSRAAALLGTADPGGCSCCSSETGVSCSLRDKEGGQGEHVMARGVEWLLARSKQKEAALSC